MIATAAAILFCSLWAGAFAALGYEAFGPLIRGV